MNQRKRNKTMSKRQRRGNECSDGHFPAIARANLPSPENDGAPGVWHVLDLMREQIEEQRAQVLALTQQLADRSAVLTGMIDRLNEMREIMPDVHALQTTVRAVADRVDAFAATAAKMPTGAVVDAAGDLVLLTAGGDMLRAGRVVAKPGATIDEIEAVAGGLRVRMTDGRLLTVDLPSHSTAAVDDTVELSPVDVATIVMEGAVSDYGEIGQRYGISARKVAQIIREVGSSQAE